MYPRLIRVMSRVACRRGPTARALVDGRHDRYVNVAPRVGFELLVIDRGPFVPLVVITNADGTIIALGWGGGVDGAGWVAGCRLRSSRGGRGPIIMVLENK